MTATTDPEEYPTRQDLIRAALVAILTGLIGFSVTYYLFVRPTQRNKSLAGLDRRGAETSQPAAYRQSGDQAAAFALAYMPVGGSVLEKRKSQLEIKEPERKQALAAATRTEATPTPTPTSLPLPDEDYQQRSSHLQVKNPKLTTQATTPIVADRPGEVSYSEAWQRVSAGWVTFGDGTRIGGEGVLVAPDLILTTLSCSSFTEGKGYLAGQYITTTLEASDPSQDLALLKILSGGGGIPVPISPDAPEADQILICGDTINLGKFKELRSRGQAGPCSGFYGWNSAQFGGSPLINNRGEVVALSLPRPGWNSMSWNIAISAAELARFVSSKPAPGGPPVQAMDLWVKSLRARVGPQPDRSPPSRANSRVLAGQAMGNYPLGLTMDTLKKELGAGQVIEQKGGFLRILYSAPRLTFTLADGLVVAIDTDYNFYTTESGWSVGSRLSSSDLRTQLPGAVSHMRDNFDALCTSGMELVFQSGEVSSLRVMVP
ncbi:trypsin-like peptidase domain-containing protein [bacterium]|nr:trypsin-like peptidase domain-containing protein [bacterium]